MERWGALVLEFGWLHGIRGRQYDCGMTSFLFFHFVLYLWSCSYRALAHVVLHVNQPLAE